MALPAAAPHGHRAARTAPPDGLLAVDKPRGVTSHDVVESVRRRLGARGAGHLGTLDPSASGLLLIATGAATRCVPVWQGGEKSYQATLRLGLSTTTQDLDGDPLEHSDRIPNEAQLRDAARAFVGDILQVPPMVSALHHRGERLYEIARRGETVERPARPVHVSEWEWLSFDLPDVTFRVRCSGGTYVRTLAHDLGAALGCGAALAQLRRLRSEPFGLERSVSIADIAMLPADEVWARGGIPLSDALAHRPFVTLTDLEAESIGRGGRPARNAAPALAPLIALGPRSIVLRDASGTPLGLGDIERLAQGDDRLQIRPQVVFPWAARA